MGNAGGVRVSKSTSNKVRRLVIMTSLATARQVAENPYHDRIEKDVLIYTGAGKTGHQSLSGINARLPQQLTDLYPIYGFQLVHSRRDPNKNSKRWQFFGLLQYLRHFPEIQRDTVSEERRAWIFELRIFKEPSTVTIASDKLLMRDVIADQQPIEDEVVVIDKHGQDCESEYTSESVEKVRAKLLTYEPRKFELFIGKLLRTSGFVNIEVTKFSQDGGIDINAKPNPTSWPIRQLLIQKTRNKTKVFFIFTKITNGFGGCHSLF